MIHPLPKMKYGSQMLYLFLLLFLYSCANEETPGPPNVILVLTDDQGIGELGCHGNPWIQTPNIDQFYEEAYRLTNFHVSPLCTPTRSALITGQYPINNGTWATFKGRASLHHTSPTMAELFQQHGYATGMFGKWHLGDNYPARPTDCGFDVAIHHASGGLGEITDHWDNDYFDDTYHHNNQPQGFSGYCTKIWFDEAMKFMRKHKEKPFFVYLSTNAPHYPLIVEESYSAPYKSLAGKEIPSDGAEFYGMITNIDEHFGRLRRFLDEQRLTDNTILIFMTDNGTGHGIRREDGKLGWNKGFSGRKAQLLEGGHRVPFFIHWPDKGIEGGVDVDELSAHIDLIPTLTNMCGISLPTEVAYDGLDISSLFEQAHTTLAERSYFVHFRQDYKAPMDMDQSCVAKGKWRLLHGKELYDMESDQLQLLNVADQYPEVVEALRSENQQFVELAKTRKEYQNIPPTVIGNPSQNTAFLTIQHAVGEDGPIYSQSQVAEGVKNRNNKHFLFIEKEGTYRISLQRWPNEQLAPIRGTPASPLQNRIGSVPLQAISPEKASITIQGQTLAMNIDEKMLKATFELELKAGKTTLEADFIEKGERFGAYYVYVTSIVEPTPGP